MIDFQVDLGIVGYRPTGDFTSVHGQGPSWCRFLLHWDSSCFGVGFVDEVLGCPAVYQGGGVLFISIGSYNAYFDHDFLFAVVPGCSDSAGWVWFCNGFLPRVAVA